MTDAKIIRLTGRTNFQEEDDEDDEDYNYVRPTEIAGKFHWEVRFPWGGQSIWESRMLFLSEDDGRLSVTYTRTTKKNREEYGILTLIDVTSVNYECHIVDDKKWKRHIVIFTMWEATATGPKEFFSKEEWPDFSSYSGNLLGTKFYRQKVGL